MYTVDELRAIIKEELDKNTGAVFPVRTDSVYSGRRGETLAASFDIDGLQSLSGRY